jgi:adenylate cyclase
VALGFPVAVVLAWVLDVTPGGIKVTGPSESLAGDEETLKSVSAVNREASIAVLPFANMSDDPGNEYFSDGLSEELLTLLSRMQSLRVCSRTTTFALKAKNLDMPTIAKRLSVRHVLEGSVRRSGSHVRIAAQLIDAVEDRLVWSETYDRELKDIFEVQDEIASRIFAAFKLSLNANERRAMQSTTASVEAYDCCLRGRDLYHRTEPGHLDQSCRMFEEAIRIDPDYALAYAGLTYCYVDTYWYLDNEEVWIERAQESSRHAVELAPHLAESHTARGLAFRVKEQFREAEEEFEKALAINPRLFEPLHFYAQMVRSMGDFERAAELFRRAADARPEDYQARAMQAAMYNSIGDDKRARATAAEAVELARRAFELNPSDSRAMILGASCQYTLGNREKALEWAALAQQTDPESSGVAYNAACIFAMEGEIDKALDLIERAVDLGARNKKYFETDVELANIAEHPRFKALLKRI